MTGRPRKFDDDAVIEAAMQVFWTQGYEGTSAQDLCHWTGLGKGSLYNAFGSKQKLYEKALLRYQKLGLAAQLSILNNNVPVKEKLRALLIWGIEDDLSGQERRSCMALFASMERSSKDTRVDIITQAYVKKLDKALNEVFQSGQNSGEIASTIPSQRMARAFLSSYYGLRVLGQSMRDRDFLHDVMEGMLDRI